MATPTSPRGAGRRRLVRLARPALAAAALATLAGCEFGEQTVAPGTPRPVVHAVLNPFGQFEYAVLLERTLTGRIDTPEGAFDPNDPIVTGGGEPITGATVVIRRVGGDSAIGTELVSTRSDGKGRGVYVFVNRGQPQFGERIPNALVIRRGERYTLRVTTPASELVTGATTVPFASLAPDTIPTRAFDVTRDTFAFTWPAAEGATSRYALEIQSPYGPFTLFTDETTIDVTGDLRHVFAENLPRVFVPGFIQTLQVHAVDTNYFDWYRSRNNPFTGSGLINHLQGGTGLFGALVPIRSTQFDVTAPIDDPTDGRWEALDVSGAYPTQLTLYATGALVSGRIEDVDEQPRQRGILGTRAASGELTLRVLAQWSAADTAYTLTARVRNDTLVTSGGATGDRRWRRLP